MTPHNRSQCIEPPCLLFLHCEQSLFFFRFSESNALAGAEKPQDARNEGGSPSRAISHARGHWRVSRFARRTTEKRETARSLCFSFVFNSSFLSHDQFAIKKYLRYPVGSGGQVNGIL